MNINYDLLIAESTPPRREWINVGIVLWRGAKPEILADVSSKRIGALDPNYPRIEVFKSLLDASLQDQIVASLPEGLDQDASRAMLNILISPMRAVPGGLICAVDGDLEPHISRVMDTLVRPPALTVKAARDKESQSRLESQLKAWFRGARIMGKGMDDLSKHRVVEKYPIDVAADVYSDFAYKNGALHIIETLDLRGTDHVTSALRNKAAFKSLALDMARDVVSAGGGRRLGIVAANDYGAVKSAIRLFERNADDVFSLESSTDKQRLADLLTKGLHLDGPLLQAEALNAS